MCEVCAIFGMSDHWVDQGGLHDSAFPVEDIKTHRAERQFRIRLINHFLSGQDLRCRDWDGDSFVLEDGQGRQVVAGDLGKLWAAAERMCGRVFDPLVLSGEPSASLRPYLKAKRAE